MVAVVNLSQASVVHARQAPNNPTAVNPHVILAGPVFTKLTPALVCAWLATWGRQTRRPLRVWAATLVNSVTTEYARNVELEHMK